jgi:hypothetical protein
MRFNRNRGEATAGLLAATMALALAGCAQDRLGSGGAPATGSVPPRAAPPPPPPPAPMAVPDPVPAPPPVYRVANGSASVLARFPRGTVVTLQTEICLKAGEQVTVSGSNGQTVTYNRPGCLKRAGRPTPENAGGFTFGWRAPTDGAAERGAAK